MARFYDALRQRESEQKGTTLTTQTKYRPVGSVDATTKLVGGGVPMRSMDAMQELRTSLEAKIGDANRGRVIAFSSARPGEGKTTVVSEFVTMLTLTQGRSVLVVDAGPGFNFIRRHAQEALPFPPPNQVIEVGGAFAGKLSVMRAELFGNMQRRPTLTASLLDQILKAQQSLYDYVLVDLPSVSEHAESAEVGRITDGVVLVVEAERTRWPVVRRTKEDFERGNISILGVFLNRRKFYIPKKVYRWL